MAKYCGDHNSEYQIQATVDFKQICLISGGSLFTKESIWDLKYVQELDKYFVGNLDVGDGDFFSKLETQLELASHQAKILMAEMLWFMLLCPSNIGADSKRSSIKRVFSLSGNKLEDVVDRDIQNKYFSDEVLSGIGSTGTAYNTGRWREVVYLIRFTKSFLLMPKGERNTLLSNHKQFALWLDEIPGNDVRQFRHMMLFLFFPDFHERIFSNTDRCSILLKFTDLNSAQYNKLKVHEIDERLYLLRQKFKDEYQTDQLDYYVEPLKSLWKDDASSNRVKEPTKEYYAMGKDAPQSTAYLNQILYGPPGTGKTYSTIDKAIGILEPGIDTRELDRTQLKSKFDQYVEDGCIHFVTFHQSFSYEDFVEGIKATTSGEGISYTVESGIFKKACEAVSASVSGLSLDEAFNQFVEDIIEKPIVLKTPRGKEFTASYKGGNTTITCMPHASEEKRELPASMAYIKQVLRGVRPDNIYCESYVNGIANYIKSAIPSSGKTFEVGQSFNGYKVSLVSEDIVQLIKPNGNVLPFPMSILRELKDLVEQGQISIEDISNKEWRKADSNIEPYLVNGYPNLVPLLVGHLLSGSGKTGPKPEELQPTVLIIDEINRGNISSIFGELITLIEPSKRAGAEEALSVTLPYSKETLQVPRNLYLIGTMNTADRSLALMDTALRRRFDFVEMMPDVELLDGVEVRGIDIKEMLTIMNKRIEVLYDREHTLGHAFFMPLKKEEDEEKRFALLQNIFSNKILPLLEEYFFEDWAKIRLVLGDNYKATEHQFISENGKDYDTQTLFGANADLDYEVEESKSYFRNHDALSQPRSYIGVYEI